MGTTLRVTIPSSGQDPLPSQVRASSSYSFFARIHSYVQLGRAEGQTWLALATNLWKSQPPGQASLLKLSGENREPVSLPFCDMLRSPESAEVISSVRIDPTPQRY